MFLKLLGRSSFPLTVRMSSTRLGEGLRVRISPRLTRKGQVVEINPGRPVAPIRSDRLRDLPESLGPAEGLGPFPRFEFEG